MSTALMAVLMASIASAVLITSRAMPVAQDPSDAVLDGSRVADQIASDLLCAQSFTTRTQHEVEFTVADRNTDDVPETIRYAWSGTPGDPLIWQYNAGTEVSLLDDVQNFDLAYIYRTITETTVQEVTADSGEVLLGFFEGWDGITVQGTPMSDWASEYFVAGIPDGVGKLTISRVMLKMQRLVPGTADKIVAIHKPAVPGSPEPASSPLGTPAVVDNNSLPTIPMWVPFYFSDVVIENPDKEYCIVVTGTPWSGPLFYSDRNAPADTTVGLWSTDGGASWAPAANKRNQNDMLFHAYGSYGSTTTQEVEASRYFITVVNIKLRAGSETSFDIETAAQVLNTPEVAAP
ncbi:MAG: hypothetical protein JSU68_00520 [Phycisphaerales bacterium]|nr:MAG: hypothetical protein JSU68_00520 [Phycisphaerales bacterium]